MTGASHHLSFGGGVLTAVVATADAGGSLCEPALAALGRALQWQSAKEPVRAVLLVSENKNFCTGGNIAAFGAAADPGAEVRRQAEALHACLEVLATAPVPVVAAVNGWAAGAGMSLVCQCDLVVAGESTRLRPGYPALGFSPDGGLTWTLPRIVGAGHAREILYTDRIIDAAEALRLGLVHRVVSDGEIIRAATELAQRLAAGPTGAYGRIKRLLDGGATNGLSAQLAAEADAVSFGAGTAEGREGVAAFLQRRAPVFGPPDGG